MDTKIYAEIIHSRICHVQNLTSALCGLEITGFGALLLQKNLLTDIAGNLTLFIFAYAMIFWMHLFSLYQYFAVKKAALVLANMEEGLQDYTGVKYFNIGNGRFQLYFIAHGLPSIIAITAPIAFYFLKVIELPILGATMLSFLIGTGISLRLLKKGFGF